MGRSTWRGVVAVVLLFIGFFTFRHYQVRYIISDAIQTIPLAERQVWWRDKEYCANEKLLRTALAMTGKLEKLVFTKVEGGCCGYRVEFYWPGDDTAYTIIGTQDYDLKVTTRVESRKI